MKVLKSYTSIYYVLLSSGFTIIFSSFSFSQSFDDFLRDYKITENQKIDSLENIFSQNNKINFTAYLPAVSYNLLDKDFRITYSVNHLAAILKQKKRNKLELAKLKQNAVNNLAMKVDRLAERYDNINTSFTDLLSDYEILNLDYEVYNLKKQQYENNKINYESYLNAKRSFFIRKKVIKNKANSLITKTKHLLLDLRVSKVQTEKFWLLVELQKIFSSVRRDWKPVKSEV